MKYIIRLLRRRAGFTLIELLTVMAVIAILAGLILSVSGWAQKKAARSRAEAEIQAMSAACEQYKADNGAYPHQPLAVSGTIPATAGAIIPSDALYPAGPNASGNSAPTNYLYANASLELYEALTGDLANTGTSGAGSKNYIVDMKPDVFGRNNMSAPVGPMNTVAYLQDPFGDCYGYSTAYATTTGTGGTTNPPIGYNTTFDLWSTGGSLSNPYVGTGTTGAGAPGDPMLQWVKNW